MTVDPRTVIRDSPGGDTVSTYLYLECQDHTPPLLSHGEVGQHLSDLPRVREEITRRDLFDSMAKADLWPDHGSHFTSNAVSFLVQHPHCRITIRDEYGVEHPVAEESV